jgi:membrane protein required for colicin V production
VGRPGRESPCRQHCSDRPLAIVCCFGACLRRSDFRESLIRGAHADSGNNRNAHPRWFLLVNGVDLILVLVLALFGLRGFFRGLFREILSLAGLIAGFILAVAFFQPVASYAAGFWKMPPLILKGSIFVIIFFLVYFLFNLVGWLLHRSESLLFLKTVNRAGGVAIGLGKGAAIMALIIFFLSDAAWLPKAGQEKFHGSYLVSPLSHFAESLIRISKQRVLFSTKLEQPSSPGAKRL